MREKTFRGSQPRALYARGTVKVTVDTTGDAAENIEEGSATKTIGNVTRGDLSVDE